MSENSTNSNAVPNFLKHILPSGSGEGSMSAVAQPAEQSSEPAPVLPFLDVKTIPFPNVLTTTGKGVQQVFKLLRTVWGVKLTDVLHVSSAGDGIYILRRIHEIDPEPFDSSLSTLIGGFGYTVAELEQHRKEAASLIGTLGGMSRSARKSASSSANLRKAREKRWAGKKSVGELVAEPVQEQEGEAL